jgi:hypothetical protein
MGGGGITKYLQFMKKMKLQKRSSLKENTLTLISTISTRQKTVSSYTSSKSLARLLSCQALYAYSDNRKS